MKLYFQLVLFFTACMSSAIVLIGVGVYTIGIVAEAFVPDKHPRVCYTQSARSGVGYVLVCEMELNK